MQVTANGIRIHYTLNGPAAAPAVTLSHSLATTLAMWEPQVRVLAERYRIVRFDTRGHGGTDAPPGPYTLAMLAADALALLDALGIQRTHFVGLSMGGATALALAELHPDRLDRVVVCDSPCMSTPAGAQQWEERIATASKGGMEALVDSTLARWFPQETLAAKPAHVERVRAMILSTPVEGFIGGAAALSDHDYNAAVATVTRPVLFIAGSKDGVTPAAMQDMQKRLPGSRYVELEGAGHISNLDRPAEFTRAVREFIQGK